MTHNRISIGILFLLCGINFASWAIRIPDFKDSLHLTDAQLGGLLMGLPIGSMISLPLAGWLLTIYRSKMVCVWSIIGYVIILPILGFIQNSYQLFLGLFLFGMVGDLLNISMNTQVVSLEGKIGKTIMSSFHAIFSIGLMLGSILGGLISQMDISPLKHFSIIALLNFLSIVFFHKYLINEEPQKKELDRPSSRFFNLNPFLIILSLIAFCGMLCEGAMADWITVYFKETIIFSKYPNSIGFSFFALAMVLGRLIGDFISNKFGITRLLVVSGGLIALGTSTLLYTNYLPLMVLGCFISGLGISTIVPIIYSAAGNSKQSTPSVAIASVSTIAYVGFLIGPVLIGYLSDMFTLRSALMVLIMLGILTSLISLFFLPKLEK
jgi:MFS family permease